MTQRKHTCFCGIDVGKTKHVACVINADGQFIVRSQSFGNDGPGFDRLLERLSEAGGPNQVLVGIEATGHYWYALHELVQRHAYETVVLNPLQTAQKSKKSIRKRKTDKIDAHHIATLIKNAEHRPSLVPDDFAMTCRQLTRLWYALGTQGTRYKLLIRSRLEPVWPEYETYFAKPFCATSRALLALAPTPQDLLHLEPEVVSGLIRRTSRGRLGAALTEQIRQSAANSIGMRRGLDGARIGIRILLNQLDALKPVRQQLETQFEALGKQLPPCIHTLPGVSATRAVSLFGEIDPISTFDRPEKLVAFAGLDMTVFQTGQYEAPKRKISKRGSPYLRRTLWGMAQTAVCQEGDLRTYYLRRRSQGLHYLAAVTAAANKLCRIVWRILTDQRDYTQTIEEKNAQES